MNKYGIILAAGKGTRMNSDLPKCALSFCGKPMIEYIANSCKKASLDDLIVVVGHKKEEIMKVLGDGVKYVYQEHQLGTADAALKAEKVLLNKEGLCLVFPGDMPLIDESIITGLIKHHQENNNALTVVTTVLNDPMYYGRIYKENGQVKRIIEYKDCTELEKQIKEINSALYCVDLKLMFDALHKVGNNNNSNEYYFTDIVEILSKDYKVDSYIVDDSRKLIGINDMETLKKVEGIYINSNEY